MSRNETDISDKRDKLLGKNRRDLVVIIVVGRDGEAFLIFIFVVLPSSPFLANSESKKEESIAFDANKIERARA